MKITARIVTLALLLALTAGLTHAEVEYKKYDRRAKEKVLVELEITPDQWVFTVFSDDEEEVHTYAISDIQHVDDQILCGDDVQLSEESMNFPEVRIDNDEIDRIDVRHGDEPSDIILSFISTGIDRETGQFNRDSDDLVSYFNDVTIDNGTFIRGSVISFFGNISVLGEVNYDVVSIFGDVYVGNEAVIRGDVIAINGKVELEGQSSVYGVIKSSKGKSSTRRHRARRWKSYQNQIGMTGSMSYNRVDGLTLWGGAEYEHADSIIPSFKAVAGYAFASERWRYDLSLTQTVIRGSIPVQVGGQFFRRLASDDDKIITESENTIFALLFNEDWKDYYESQGGYGFARVKFLKWNKFEIGYLTEEQRWLDAHSKLWSLFGTKDFRGNFSSVPYDTLAARKLQFNDQQISSLVLNYTFDNRDDEKHPRRGWLGWARYEYSPQRWRGDFDFQRFETRLTRYQPLGRYLTLDLTGAYGYADGDYIPLSRLFYLGGLGTIHGYRHKEFIGTEYVNISGEYRFEIPHSDIAPFVLYDGGRIMGERITGENKWYSSIGLGVDLNRNVKIFMAQRLDVSDKDPVFYARFSAAIQ
jgi:hypothetical protein